MRKGNEGTGAAATVGDVVEADCQTKGVVAGFREFNPIIGLQTTRWNDIVVAAPTQFE